MKVSEEIKTVATWLRSYPTDQKNIEAMAKRLEAIADHTVIPNEAKIEHLALQLEDAVQSGDAFYARSQAALAVGTLRAIARGQS
ncbi:MAG TPA: hypothetical protein PKO06_08700 [Candidatus Ozemobacteraceae bacterium]|nr:hypothetical protein [Candidatus Ozemobacteraceae bacterium]